MKFKAVAPYLSAALLLSVCLLLPLAFVPKPETALVEPESVLEADSRVQTFALYDGSELEQAPIESGALPADSLARSEGIFAAVMENLVIDGGEVGQEIGSGTNSYALERGGDRMLVTELYREWNGDWHNWLRIWLDAESGVVYRLYYSANVLENAGAYVSSWEGLLAAAAEETALALGFEGWEAAADGPLSYAVTLTDENGVKYNYSAVLLSYEDSAPSLIVDLDIKLESLEAS